LNEEQEDQNLKEGNPDIDEASMKIIKEMEIMQQIKGLELSLNVD
jgi:hypothetical protein